MNLPKTGQKFTFQGDTFSVAFISGETVRFTSVAGGRQRRVPLATFLKMMASDEFSFDDNDSLETLTNYSEAEIKARNELFSLIKFVESQTDTPRSQKKVGPILDTYGKQHDVVVPSASNFARKYKSYVASNYNLDSLIPYHRGKGNRKERLSVEQEKIISNVLHEHYFKVNGKSLRECHTIIRDSELETQAFQASPTNYKRVSYPTIVRRANAFDIHYRLSSRYSPAKADKKLRASGIKHDVGFPLQYVEADGQIVDCMVVDEETGKVLGRPNLTLFIDRCTRAILSYKLSLRAFSLETVLGAFRDALRQDNGLPGGRISNVIVDNGSDYKSNAFRSAVLSVGCDLKPCRIKDPNSKPFVESVFRTLNLRCFHTLDGTTFSNPAQYEDYDPAAEAKYTLQELDAILLNAIIVYHESIHSQLNGSPILDWQDWLNKMNGVIDEVPRHEIRRVNREEKVISINKGTVRFNSLTYKSHDLSAIVERKRELSSSEKVSVSVSVFIDLHDLSSVLVENPFDKNAPLIEAVSTDPNYTKDLTMYAHQLNLDEIKKRRQQQERRLEAMGVMEKHKNIRKKNERIKDNAELRKQIHLKNQKQLLKAEKARKEDELGKLAAKVIPLDAEPNKVLTNKQQFKNMAWENDDE
jgi:transposase InsO family protein